LAIFPFLSNYSLTASARGDNLIKLEGSNFMDEGESQIWAVDALGALAHETRLAVFRMLVQAGPDGLVAGAIAARAGVPPSTMSHHLASLERAGLVQSERESRLIHYRVDFGGMRRLLGFLMQDCCQGSPEMCGDLAGAFACD
jgi:DNA-binding transcriptional ArsR family regulator